MTTDPSPMPFLLLMPSYNHAHYIGEAVRSVLAQDDGDWELWILDNSSDDTPRVMQEFQDPRIRFHHEPQRMTPAACLNWMLERAEGRDFSYVHTDNNLHRSYVRMMRAALATHPLALAYCDMRTIDETGRRIGVCRRGSFDLARLFSLDPLGVPFSATTELGRQLGGFNSRDLADDVRFCAEAYGLAYYVHVRDPLVDYREHHQSRTASAGGMGGVRQGFLNVHAALAPELQRRGIDVLGALRQATKNAFGDLEWFLEDQWYRKLSRVARPWWDGDFSADALFEAGLLQVEGLRNTGSTAAIGPWASALMKLYLASRRRDLRRLTEKIAQVLVPWAALDSSARETVIGEPASSLRTTLVSHVLGPKSGSAATTQMPELRQ